MFEQNLEGVTNVANLLPRLQLAARAGSVPFPQIFCCGFTGRLRRGRGSNTVRDRGGTRPSISCDRPSKLSVSLLQRALSSDSKDYSRMAEDPAPKK